jgi:hypothetical protein
MKKHVKQTILKVLVVGLSGVFIFGGAAGSVYFLWMNAQQQRLMEEFTQQWWEEQMAQMMEAEATMSATPAAELVEIEFDAQ